jgi:predicted permease
MTRLVARLRSLWWNLARRDQVERALDDELRTYVDLLAADYVRAGMPPELARRAALVDAGGIEQVKEATRDAWVGNAFATGARELRYALRSLRRAPGFLAIAVATLAIGIGGATAVFTVIKASLLQPLPAAAEPERLVTVERVQQTRVIAEFSFPDYKDLNERTTALTGLAGFNGTSMALENATGSARAWISFVTDNFFTVLGVRPAVGRFFVPEASETEVIVLGHALWQKRFGGATSAIGSTVKLDGNVFTIVGVAPPGFIGGMTTNRMDAFIPFAPGGRSSIALGSIDLADRRDSWLRLVGRLAPGKSVDDAQRELAALAGQLAAAYPTNQGRSVQVWRGTGMTTEERAEISRVPRLLAMAVALLLLIACGNVASLSLVRAASRRRELATRVALGASRAALVRQVALEGVVIAAGAGVLGVVIARLLVRSATLVRTVVSMSDLDLGMDMRVLAVALAAATLTAILVSLMPALQIFRLSPGAVLKDGGGAVRRRTGGQRALVAAQVAASLVLLTAAAIVFSAFQRVLAAHDGFNPRGLTDAMLQVDKSLPDTARQIAFFHAVLARAESEPDVAGAAVASTVPPFQWSSRATVFRRGEEPPREALLGRELELGLRVSASRVSRRFFDVMKIPVVRGRAFTASDDARSEHVAIVTRRMAEALWPGRDPIGQYIAWPAVKGPARAPLRVVGVAEDTREVSLAGDPPLAMYVPFEQHPGTNLLLVLRGRSSAVTPASLRRIVAAVNPDVTVLGGRTLLDRLEDEVRPQRTASAWIGVFGAIALLLSAIGLYGIVAQSVLQRTRELAVRSALGATPGGILVTVLGDGMRLAAIGGVVGLAGSVGAQRVLRSLFSGIEAGDIRPATLAAALIALAMLAATYVPARRASKLNPVDALRSD